MDLYCSHAILAQAGPPPPNPGNLLVGPLVPMMIILITVFYITNRSQRKKIKEHEQKLNTLKPGDKILTSGGLLGVVITVKESRSPSARRTPSWKLPVGRHRNHRTRWRLRRILIDTMNRNNLGKFIFVIIVVLWSLYEVYPPNPRDLVQYFSGPGAKSEQRHKLREHRAAGARAAAGAA